MNFGGCDVVLRTSFPVAYIDYAEKELNKIIEKEFHIPNKEELRAIVRSELGIR